MLIACVLQLDFYNKPILIYVAVMGYRHFCKSTHVKYENQDRDNGNNQPQKADYVLTYIIAYLIAHLHDLYIVAPCAETFLGMKLFNRYFLLSGAFYFLNRNGVALQNDFLRAAERA